MNPISQDLLKELQEAFNIFDKKGDKVLDKDELSKVFRSFGHDITELNLNDVLNEIICDSSPEHKHKVDFPEFLLFLIRNMQDEAHLKKSVKDTFEMLDRDNDKFITKEDLEIAFREAGEELQPNELDRIFETADADGDGKISLDDYIKLMLVK